MWSLEQIYAENIGSFKKLDYTIDPGKATLIFGNNMDNESQLSNGSGKSALIEVIAIGLTGAPLRDIKTIDEIINDEANQATIDLLLHNSFTGMDFSVRRVLSRKNPQVIELSISKETTDDGEYHWEPVSQASIADYNKYILEMLGLTKDDIYANYILSKHKYVSFLSCSDKDKKELINRFSNGNLVDESIAALQDDMAPLQEKLRVAETNVASCEGKVKAIEEQIQNAIDESIAASKTKVEKIAEFRSSIRQLNEDIAEYNDELNVANDSLDSLIKIEESLTDIEDKDMDFFQSYTKIVTLFEHNKFSSSIIRYEDKLNSLTNKLSEYNEKRKVLQTSVKNIQEQLLEQQTSHENVVKSYDTHRAQYESQLSNIEEELKELEADLKKTEELQDKLYEKQRKIVRRIREIENILAGAIVCPKCGHEFILDSKVDLETIKSEKKTLVQDSKTCDKEIKQTAIEIEGCTNDIKSCRNTNNEIHISLSNLDKHLMDSKNKVNTLLNDSVQLSNSLDTLQESILNIEEQIKSVKSDMFNTAFDELDVAITQKENQIKLIEDKICTTKGRIQSYKESIEDLEHASETDFVDTLKKSKLAYDEELAKAVKILAEIDAELSTYKKQEATFIEFKTHLANSKIEALSSITNEFLEAIGSDIRIVFSGYTVLKSGKVRDKISISLTRDGIDCGSFGKFSEGEKARVNLANILAMHKLTNVNCPEGKGLDLLILDEILDATDESGLANIFESLNNLKLTSLVVSHGLVQEGYPHKLIVNKKNGISYIE